MTNINIKIISTEEHEIWDRFIDNSPSGSVFHKFEWLKAAESHSGFKLYPLAVYKGDVFICAFPVYYHKKKSLKIILSPPNACGIPHLGPVFHIETQKVYNYEKIYFNIMDQLIEFLSKQIGFDYLRIAFPPYLNDMRPLIWNNFRVSPNYTYEIYLRNGADEVYHSFDSRVRQFIRNAEKNNSISIRKLNSEGIPGFIKLIKERYKDQGKEFKISEKYISELLKGSLAENIHFIGAYLNSNIISGLVLLEYKNRVLHWLGAISPKEKITGINELLHWETIKEFESNGFKSYELMGANTKHLCQNKSKYNPDLVNYYVAEKSSWKGRIALSLFNRLR